MRVKNIIVSDVDNFSDILIRELIFNGISYVQVGNEFHFSDHIYRLFDYNDKVLLKGLSESLVPSLIECSPEMLIDVTEVMKLKNDCYTKAEGYVGRVTKKEVRKNYPKQLVKSYNRMLNQKLKTWQ